MPVCDLCGCEPAVHIWQPFGPDIDPRNALVRPGYHHRGFGAIKVCERCATFIREGNIAFRWRKQVWVLTDADLHTATEDELIDLFGEEDQ